MVNAAAVVYVYLEETATTVSVEDIKEWLQFIDKVVEMKLQYDAASKQTCYAVEFRTATAAQQAVQYLNGARFKNCVVTIKSRVYQTVASETAATSPAASPGSSAAPSPSLATRKRCRETAELPHNHCLPADLQMDQLLVEQLPDAAAAEGFEEVAPLWDALKGAQEQLTATYTDLDTVKEELAAADAMLTRLLGVHKAGNMDSGRSAGSAVMRGTPSSTLAAQRCVSHQRGIAVDADTPSAVVAFVTASFGPLAFCTVTTTQREFFMVLRFVFAADEQRFLTAASSSDGSSSGGSGGGAARVARTERERRLLSLAWASIDFSITSHDYTAQRPCDEARQQRLRERLTALASS